MTITIQAFSDKKDTLVSKLSLYNFTFTVKSETSEIIITVDDKINFQMLIDHAGILDYLEA